jgi:hypothetical protein
MSFYGSRRAKFSIKLKIVPKTRVAEAVKKAHPREAVPHRPIAIFAKQLLRTNSRPDQSDEGFPTRE